MTETDLETPELIALDLDDITIIQAGLTILVRRSKTDQEGQGREIGIPRSRKSATCPVAALEAWLDLTKSPPIDSTREQIENSCVDGKPPNEGAEARLRAGR
jgi:hypothetical protein